MNKIEFIQHYLEENYAYCLRYDIVSDKLEVKIEGGKLNVTDGGVWREMTKRDINSIVCACCEESGMNISDREVRCVLQSDYIPTVHPPRAYLDHLPAYKPVQGQTPLDYLASQVIVEGGDEEQKLWHDTFIRWFVAMVASWRSDEVVNQHVLVLIGPQGIYKTTWLERLIPPCLRPYSMKMANVRDLNKDERLRIAESVLINMDEIDSMSDRELNQMKSLITSADVNERAAYGYNKERRTRLASFCASGNKDQFLTDTTGNRRWLPFRVKSIQNPYRNPLQPYEMYYAQAVWMIEHGFEYWFDQEQIQELAPHVESFHKETSEEQLLPVYYAPASKDTPDAVFRTAAEISARLSYLGNIRQPMALS
ncbi:MAG: virulence-associated E family protein [Paludibacteraceae bacterium]|nr:virulence-associated E family protein [Paludibacteraceae bacterium]